MADKELKFLGFYLAIRGMKNTVNCIGKLLYRRSLLSRLSANPHCSFTMYPIGLIPETQPLKLPNFKWVPSLRPTLTDVFDRTIRPSRREDSGERKRPTFGIVQRMDRRKEMLIRTGEWYDREDELTPELIEWRNSRPRN